MKPILWFKNIRKELNNYQCSSDARNTKNPFSLRLAGVCQAPHKVHSATRKRQR